MRVRFVVELEIVLTEWALPLEIWWTKTSLCFEVLCFAITFCKPLAYSASVYVDELVVEK